MRTRYLGTAIACALLLAACGGGTTSTEDDAEADGTTDGGTSTETPPDDEAAAGEDPAGDGPTVTLGSIHPLTGALALDGNQMDEAVQMAAEELNESGEYAFTLEVSSADDQGAPEEAQAQAQRLVDEGVSALIGTYTSAATTNVATVAARSQVPLVIDVAVADAILDGSNTFVYRIQPNASSMGAAGADYLQRLAEDSGEEVTRVAVMHEQTDFGTSVSEAFGARAEELGMEIVEDIAYDAFAASDYTPQVQQAAAADPDVIVVTGYYNDGVQIATNLGTVQPEILGVLGVANGAFDLPQFPGDAGGDGAWYFDANYHFDATNERTQEIRDRFEERTGDEMRTSAVLSYQAVEVIAEAASTIDDPTDPVALSEAIREVSVEPLLAYPGPIEFDEAGENVNATPILMQVQDEAIEQVLPEEFATSEPQFPATPWSPPAS